MTSKTTIAYFTCSYCWTNLP